LTRLPDAKIVMIDNYKEVFNRKKQCFDIQKQSTKLILAVKRPPFLYPLSHQCQTFGEPYSMYTTPVINCPFDCSYCFLKGMYDSANIVVFVNTEDFFAEVKQAAAAPPRHASRLQLNISYDSDLMALEKLTGICSDWIRFTRTIPNLLVELRTKSGAFSQIRTESPVENFVLAWSLSPDAVVDKYETGTPRLKARLKAVALAARDGWPLRLCFDPVVPIENGLEQYRLLIRTVFETVPTDAVRNVSVGPLRMGDDHLKKVKKADPRCELFWKSADLETEALIRETARLVSEYVGKEKTAVWQSQL
jgi:spore photoproduct lyase